MITDLARFQETIFYRLLSCSQLNLVNIQLERKLRLAVAQDPVSQAFIIDPLELVNRSRSDNGPRGLGVLIEMPELRQAQSSGGAPDDIVAFPIVILEEPLTNFTPQTEEFGGGTGITAEEGARLVRRCLRHFFVGDMGEFYDDQIPIKPTPDGEFPGLVGYRATLLARVADENIARLTTPAIAVEDADGGLQVTLTPADDAPDSLIYYTVANGGAVPAGTSDFPGPANPVAIRYEGPFLAQPGDVVAFAAYQDGPLPSNVDRVTLNA